MKQWRFEISSKQGFPDVHGADVLEDIRQLNISSVEDVISEKVFLIEADFEQEFAERVGRELLADPVCQDWHLGKSGIPAGPMQATLIEVHLKSGVTDPVAESVRSAMMDMGAGEVASVRTGRKYVLLGSVSDAERETIARRVLANDCIEDVIFGMDTDPPSPHTQPYEMKLTEIPIRDINDEQLMQLSKKMDMFLNLKEMQTIQDEYQK
ncbi:MAG: phosphoribosylformylglycinamidine synthase subunit PurS, partial [Planctomycetota bacterium]